MRNLRIKFIQEKVSDVLKNPDLDSISDNKKAKNIPMDITYYFGDKLGHWKNNCKNYLASLKQDASVASKSVYII